MRRSIGSSFAAMGIAAAIVLPSAHAAQGRGHRDHWAERPIFSIGQSVDRANAQIAELKASLRLSPDQAANWPALESTLREIAMKRARRLADETDLQTGRSSSESSAASAARPLADEDEDVDSRPEPDARDKTRQDDIAAMRRDADSLAVRAANLRQIADSAKPLYDSLDDWQRRRLVQFVRGDARVNDLEESRGRRR